MKRFIATLSLILLIAISTKAQVVPTVDSTTYRQFFVVVTADRSTLPQGTTQNTVPNDGQTGISDRQLSFLRMAGLSNGDDVVAAGILLGFRTSYDALVTAYNNYPATLGGTNNATPAFLTALETLVQTTIAELNNSASITGMANLNAYLQSVRARTTLAISKTITVYPEQQARLVNAAYHPKLKNAGVTVNGCTITPNYNASMHLSMVNSPQLPGYGGVGSGLTYFNIRELVTGPNGGFGTYGLDTSTSKPGAYVLFNIAYNNTAQPVGQITVTMSGAGSTQIWHIFYADSGGGPWIDTGVIFTPDKSGDNVIPWPTIGQHTNLKLVLENTPGSGPVWTQARFYDGLYVQTSGVTEGTSTVSGNCSGIQATGFSTSYLDTFLCYNAGPAQSLTSWLSVVDSGSMFLTDNVTHDVKWEGIVSLVTLGNVLFASNGGNWDQLDLELAQTMFSRTGSSTLGGHTTPVARICDIVGTPPDFDSLVAITLFNANLDGKDGFGPPLSYFLGSSFMVRDALTGGLWVSYFQYFKPGWSSSQNGGQGWVPAGWKCTAWDKGRRGSSNCGGGPC